VKGLILSGGKGTRLRPITHTSAKQLVPVANKPILFFAIEALVAAGVPDIGIITGETGDEVRAAVGDGSRFGATITFIPQSAPLGLAHAVVTARDFLGDSDFIMYLGDNLIRDGVTPLVREFQATRPDATILLAHVPEPERFGVAELHDGRVTRLVEKPIVPASDLALVGVYLFSSAVHDAIDRISMSPRGELEITDAIQRLIDDGRCVVPHVIEGWWKDTGRLEDILEANRIMLDMVTPRNEGALSDDVRIEGRVVVERGARLHGSLIRGPAIIGEGTLIENAYVGPFTSIYFGCTVRNAEIENSIVLENSVIEHTGAKIESSLVGKDCVVCRSESRPTAIKVMLGDHSRVELV
jgi:glucose-1-phosphate thymidylyltransferase